MRTTRFTVAMPRPETHLYDVTMEVDPNGAASLDLVLPVWTPGSYLVREFSRHVRDFSAKEKGGRRPIPAEKAAKNTWRLDLSKKSPGPLSIFYRVYAHELTVRTSHLDSSHGYGNGANLFFYVEGRKDEPQEVAFRLPRGWKTKAESGRLVVAEVLADGPAERAGVNAGDHLVAVDGLRATEELIARLEKERKPKSRVDVTVFRRDVLARLLVRLGGRRASVWKIDALVDAPPEARRLKKRWLASLSA